jgi:hypothetical protein
MPMMMNHELPPSFPFRAIYIGNAIDRRGSKLTENPIEILGVLNPNSPKPLFYAYMGSAWAGHSSNYEMESNPDQDLHCWEIFRKDFIPIVDYSKFKLKRQKLFVDAAETVFP